MCLEEGAHSLGPLFAAAAAAAFLLSMLLGPLSGLRVAAMDPLTDKTLVVWVSLANLEQRGGSALTLDDLDGHFDGIVFGELTPRKWMGGSDSFRRTPRDPSTWPAETARAGVSVQLALVFRGSEVALYRNGEPLVQYAIARPQPFGLQSVVVMGLRHLRARDSACLAGAIEDARVYATALTARQLRSLAPDRPSEPAPVGWWPFTDGSPREVTGRFTESLLVGAARLADGKLHLDGEGSYFVAAPAGTTMERLRRGLAGEDRQVTASRLHRRRLLADPQRPTYHFVAPEGACMPFDPNGALFWRGRYHLCYLFQDERGHCWGHVSSTDLVHWRFHEPALAPAPGDPDRGIFSGNAFIDKQGEAVLFYHGVGAGNCLATCSEDDLDHWTKSPSNPVVPIPRKGDPDFGKYRSWDPHGWLEGDTYYAVFGGNPPTLFKSEDGTTWRFVGPLLSHDLPGVDPDEDVSCPDFFTLGDKRILLCISHKRGCRYYVGRFENEQFHPESHHRMNWPGGTCFAPESLEDDRGRRLMWAWVLDRRTPEQIRRAGWSGTMTLPRVLSLGIDGTLRLAPVEELQTLRFRPRELSPFTVAADSQQVLADIRGDCLELVVELQPGEARECGLKVRRSPQGEEETLLLYDAPGKRLRIDWSRSSLDPHLVYPALCMYGGRNPPVTMQEAPFSLPTGEPLRLHVFLDRSIMEVFANNRQCVTQRIYPTRSDSLGVSVFATGAPVTVQRLQAWEMAPANPW